MEGVMNKWFNRITRVALAGMAAVGLSAGLAQADMAKNVILMISDGQGFNTVKATDFYTGSKAVYENDYLPNTNTPIYKFGVSTYDLGTYNSNYPPYPSYGYEPSKAWPSTDPTTGVDYIKAVNKTDPPTYTSAKYTDSASAATALATGVKTYNGRINVDANGNPLTTITEIADGLGKGTGVVTNVQWSHATPAGFAAHNISRNNYSTIGQEMIDSPYLDVIMGAGNPNYNDSGQTKTTPNYNYVGGQSAWNNVQSGYKGWTLIQDKFAFEALANNPNIAPDKVLGTVQAASTSQQSRDSNIKGADTANPSGVAYNTNVPSLATLTKGAINVLSKDQDGFFLMVEGGAVDWANHANNMGSMIEEQMDFNAAVQAVVDWVNANSSWNDTLLLITADHECGGLWGPDGVNLVDNGPGNLPGHKYNSGDHTNSLVPVYGIGAGAELLAAYADLFDQGLKEYFESMGFDGRYLDNTEIFSVMAGSAPGSAVPIPGAIWLLGTGLTGIGLTGYKRRGKTA
jgi:alkaline phosphatase